MSDYYEDWDSRMAKAILPLMIGLRDEIKSLDAKPYPGNFENHEEWIAVIDEIIWAFSSYIDPNKIDADDERRQAAFEAFGEYFTGFWI